MAERTIKASKKQSLILHLLNETGGSVGNIAFQKLVFFFCRHLAACGGKAPYDFYPHLKGCYSFTLDMEKEKMKGQGFLDGARGYWNIADTVEEMPVLDKEFRSVWDTFLATYAYSREEELVERMYREYPEYAVNSIIVDDVLKGDAEAKRRIEAQKLPLPPFALYTIGYEGLSLEEYFRRLKQHGVEILCDVRRVPFSHKVGFSRDRLADCCQAVGIVYKHLPELGIPSNRRRSLETQADYDVLFSEYEAEDIPAHADLLAKLAKMVKGGHRMAFTCMESDPRQCHRRIVGEHVARLAGAPLVHLVTPSYIWQKEYESLCLL